MFTGLIEETGIVTKLLRSADHAALTVEAPQMAPELARGESVAVNGVCLTVVECTARDFRADLSAETLRRSSFTQGLEGKVVNLERALPIAGRLGGHIVQGHVDGTGSLISARPSGDGFDIEFSVPADLERYLAVKGSIAVDGISLTVASLKPGSFSVAIIPHTFRATNLCRLRAGDRVNLETDILAKYVERFLNPGSAGSGAPESKLTVQFLKEQGF